MMKLATLISSRCPSVAMLVLLPLFLIGLANRAASNPVSRSLSHPLQNPDTFQAAYEVAAQAQSVRSPNESSIRLTPIINSHEDRMKICCVHANILDFYLKEILPHHNSNDAHLHRLRVDLSRVSEDLQAHGCNASHYRSHHYTETFHTKLRSVEHEHRVNKAVGEIDILFSHLQDYCVSSEH